jgi:hypothetical protein
MATTQQLTLGILQRLANHLVEELVLVAKLFGPPVSSISKPQRMHSPLSSCSIVILNMVWILSAIEFNDAVSAFIWAVFEKEARKKPKRGHRHSVACRESATATAGLVAQSHFENKARKKSTKRQAASRTTRRANSQRYQGLQVTEWQAPCIPGRAGNDLSNDEERSAHPEPPLVHTSTPRSLPRTRLRAETRAPAA